MPSFVFVCTFENPTKIGIGTGTTNMESVLVEIYANRHNITETINSVCEIKKFGIESLFGMPSISDTAFIVPNTGVFGYRPELLYQGEAKITHERRAVEYLDNDPERAEAVENLIGMKLTGDSYRHGSPTNNTMNQYRTIFSSGVAFIVTVGSTINADAIREYLMGGTFGKQINAHFSEIHYHRCRSNSFPGIVATTRGMVRPLRPIPESLRSTFNLTHGMPFWMGTGLNRRLSDKGWMWNGQTRPLVFADARREEAVLAVSSYFDDPPDDLCPVFDLPKMPHRNALDWLVDHVIDENKLDPLVTYKKIQWVHGVCAITGLPGPVDAKRNPDMSAHSMMRAHYGPTVSLFRDSVFQRAFGISNMEGSLTMTADRLGNTHVTMKDDRVDFAKKFTMDVVEFSSFETRWEAHLKTFSKQSQTPYVTARIPDNKIGRHLSDVRWSVGSIYFDNIQKDFVDNRVFDEFKLFDVHFQKEIVARLMGWKIPRNSLNESIITPEATSFIVRFLGRIAETQRRTLSKLIKE